jgi:hypothetical protein
MRTLHKGLLAMIGMMALRAPIVLAQEQNQDKATQPIPAYHSPLASAADNAEGDDASADPQKLAPDTRALTGIQDLSIGMPRTTHSYWQPHVDLVSTVDSNPLNAKGMNGWTSWTSFNGGIDLHRNAENSAMTLSYFGGGSLSNDGNSSNGVVQGLNLSEKLTYRRYTISFLDQFLYAPQTALGSSGIPGGSTLSGGGTPGLGGGYAPGQLVLTSRGQRVTNATDAEVDAFLSARTSLTFVAGYSLLDSFDNDLLNYGNVILSAGYNYQMSRANTLGLSYQFSSFNYSNFNQAIKTNTVLVSYGRRITGRLAFQLAGGPDIAFLRTPITPPAGTTGGTGSGSTSSTTQVYGSFNTSLQYQLRRVGMTAAYSHGVSGGSGVLAGSVADTVTGSVNSQLSRTFSVGWNVGYSRNKGLAVSGTTTAGQAYDYWFTGANLNHPWGRSMNVFLSYQLQYQTSSATLCTPGAICPTSLTRNQISFGFGWHRQPIPF